LDATSSVQTQLNAKLSLSGGTMSGNIAMGSNKLTGLAAGSGVGDSVRYEQAILASGVNPFTAAQSMGSNKLTNLANGTANNDAVNFGQLTAVSNGNIWLAPLLDPDLVNDSLTTAPASPVLSTVYLIGASPTSPWRTVDGFGAGHAVYWTGGTFSSPASWIDILGRAVAIGDRFGVTMEHGSGSEGGNMVGNHNNIFVVSNATPGSYAYTITTPVTYNTVLVNNSLSQHFSHSYNYNGTSWVEIAGPGVITPGAALSFSGNTLNVLYDNVTIDLTSNQLEIKAGGISNSHINSGAAIAYSKLNLTNAIVNADINASAAIAVNKLAALTISRAIVSDGSGFLSASAVTSTELGYVSGVTSAIQTQLNAKLALAGGTMSGAIAMGTNKITGMGDPTLAQDAATKNYVDTNFTVTYNKENLTLNSTDITNQYKDLAHAVKANSLNLTVSGVMQYEGSDYSLSIPSSVTRVTFTGDLASGGNAALVSGDILHVMYAY
jgi:hypothetical protein